MKFFVFLLLFTVSINSFSQNAFSEEDAKNIINTFFEGFHSGDTLVMKSVMAKGMVMQTAYTDKKGTHKINNDDPDGFVNNIANRPADQKWEERLLSYKVEIDGNLAHIWIPYEFWFNGSLMHCGANSFTLAKLDDGWKIIHIIDSRRKDGCN
ncbi:nuclear transport factor 2 family protein [Aequorivita sp. Q41]|uniref:nuclear transport factor 2 family protein n=1 Tax=Aequorivita sp. Q41 TaxID=3153300 RepID=UPI0032424312